MAADASTNTNNNDNTTTDKKKSWALNADAWLIALVVAAVGVMGHHTYEGWKSAQGASGGAPAGPAFTHNFTGDALTGRGWWGAQTSAMNFCEEDHVVTLAIAEFVNTLSNLAYVYWAVATWPRSATTGRRALWPLPATNVSLLLLGVLSAVYHATLKHYNQIWDETGMYLLTASMDWSLYSYPGAIFSGPVAKPVYGAVLCGACAAVVVLNFNAAGADFGLHTVLFIALLTGIWPRCMWLIGERARLERAGRLRRGLTPPVAAIRTRCRVGGLAFLLGFALWLVDCVFCRQLRAARHAVGWPLAALLECHGWWHVLTAVGAGVFVDLTNMFASPVRGNVPQVDAGKED